MTQMNREWAINKLKSFLEAASITYVPSPPQSVGFAHYKLDKPRSEVQAAAQIIEQVLDRVLPGWRTADWPEGKRQPFWREREAAHRAIAQLEAEQELIEISEAVPLSSMRRPSTRGYGAAFRGSGAVATSARR